MDILWQDLAYAARRLRQAPGFAAVAITTLALGIGANSAIFTVVNAVLLKPLPFDEPEQLVQVSQTWEGRPVVYSPQNYLDLVAQAESFDGLAAYDGGSVTLTGRGAPSRLEGARVTTSFFDVLRVRPVLGRGFRDGENEPGHTKVVVLGDGLWRQRFGADAAIVGQTVQLDREPHLVVGVAPAGFALPEGSELWTPFEYDTVLRTHSRGAWYLSVIGRLEPGVTVEGARQEVATVAARLAREYPEANQGVGGTARLLHTAIVGDSQKALLVLLGAVGLVLLIACVNIANLLLARVAARGAELAIRTALGASRGRLVRQLLTESVLLAALGGIAGVALAWLSLDALLGLQPVGVPRLAEVRVDRTVLAFAAGLSLFTGLLFGAAPALQMAGRAAVQALREGGRGVLSARGGALRQGLVVGQLTLAMVLLAGAGLLIRSFARLSHVDPGFRPESALTFRLALPESAYSEDARRIAFYDDLQERLRVLPGVRSVGAVAALPLSGAQFDISFSIEGRPPLAPAQQPTLEVRIATPEYLAAMGIPVLRGRGLERGDAAGSPPVVLLSERAVRRFFPGEEPLGQRIKLGLGRGPGTPRAGGAVVGVVGDVKERGLGEDHPPQVYLPYAQFPIQSMHVLIRTAVQPLSLGPAAERVVHELDPELPVARLVTLDDLVARSVAQPRFYVVVLGVFAAMALFLAAIGIFGVMSYAVVQRSREIGIRMALGARPADVLGLVLGNACVLVGLGVAAGLLGALALSRVIAGLLFELSPTDPATLGAVALLLAAVAFLASYLPARRATAVDPLVALRSE